MIKDIGSHLRGEEDDYDDNGIDSSHNENELPDEDSLYDWLGNGYSDFEWSYSYSFPTSRRKTRFSGGKYGRKYMTFRRLYNILSDMNGEGFIDTYFKDIFPNTVKPEIEVELAEAKAQIINTANDIMLSNIRLTKRGTFDKRVNARKVLENNGFFSYRKEFENSKGDYIASKIKEDIIYSLRNGLINLNHHNKKETFEKRARLGLDAEHVFYASGQLIKSIKIFFDIKGSERWQTVHPSIMV